MEIGQTIIIIILLIISILLVVFLIADVEFPAPDFYTPFANGSKIRIRSLANGKYLVPRGSFDFPNCKNPAWNPGIQQIAADTDSPDDPHTVWTVCQYAGNSPSPGNNAVYTLFNGQENSEEILVFDSEGPLRPLTVTSKANAGCPAFNQAYPNPPAGFEVAEPYYSFVLQENGAVNTNGLKSSAYIIRSADLVSNTVAVCLGNPGLILYNGSNLSNIPPCVGATPSINPGNCTNANECPAIVSMNPAAQVIGRINPLFYTFEIEVLPKTS